MSRAIQFLCLLGIAVFAGSMPAIARVHLEMENAAHLRMPLFNASEGEPFSWVTLGSMRPRPLKVGPFEVGLPARLEASEGGISINCDKMHPEDGDMLFAMLANGALPFRATVDRWTVEIGGQARKLRWEANGWRIRDSGHIEFEGDAEVLLDGTPLSKPRIQIINTPNALRVVVLSPDADPTTTSFPYRQNEISLP